MTTDDLLTTKEIATELRIAHRTVMLWCSQGKLLAFRVGRGWRIYRSDLNAFIKSNRELNQQQNDPKSKGLALAS